jgi:imidazoleglycerol-phosphate dehydratase
MRRANLVRKTKETELGIDINLDGSGNFTGKTGIGFFDHLLQLMTFYGKFDIDVSVLGDLETGSHHTVEDIGLLLGSAFAQALSDKKGIERYGFSYIPMDETLGRTVVDLSGRPYFVFNCEFKRNDIGDLALEDIKEFFKSFANQLKANIHMEILYGENDHHKAEALFKSIGKSLRVACNINDDILPSTKGVL